MVEHKLKNGYDIKLAGTPAKFRAPVEKPKQLAMQPPDFPGIKPRLQVDIGEKVKIGTPLFIDKLKSGVNFVSPANGEVVELNRGERRAIQEVVVKLDNDDEYETFDTYDSKKIASVNREELIEKMMKFGMWPYLRQRPFSKIADNKVIPRDIFVCGMDTSPMAPDMKMLLDGQDEYFELGLKVLNKLTDGKVYLSVDGNGNEIPDVFGKVDDVEMHKFIGPHPVGNISVHIHHIKPVNMGEVIWYTYAPHVALIGKFFQYGRFPVERVVAVCGSSVQEDSRQYYDTRLGIPVQSLVNESMLTDDHVRYISGNIMSGRKLYENGYLGYYDSQLTVIPESRKRDLFGWLTPGIKDESYSRTFLSRFFRSNEYVKDTRIHGGPRAFVQTGEYEAVMPMDIYPSHLVKAIMAGEIEDMIGLGLLEVDEEDFALCSYICPSKIDFGYHIREGLDVLEKEG